MLDPKDLAGLLIRFIDKGLGAVANAEPFLRLHYDVLSPLFLPMQKTRYYSTGNTSNYG